MSTQSPLRRRLAPAVPLVLELTDDSGGKFTRSFRLCFDYNAAALIKEKTGITLSNFVDTWGSIEDPRVLSTCLYAAVLAHHPEFKTVDKIGEPTDEGLEVIRSYMDDTNSEQIAEALWKTYLLAQPADKRPLYEKALADAKKRVADGEVAARPQESPAKTEPAPATSATSSSSSGPSPVSISVSVPMSSAP